MFDHFYLPPPLVPGHDYSALVAHLDANLATVRSATAEFQASLRSTRYDHANSKQILPWRFDPMEPNVFSFRTSKLAPKLLGPYKVISQSKNYIKCVHPVLHTQHILHSSRVTPFYGTPESGQNLLSLTTKNFSLIKS